MRAGYGWKKLKNKKEEKKGAEFDGEAQTLVPKKEKESNASKEKETEKGEENKLGTYVDSWQTVTCVCVRVWIKYA